MLACAWNPSREVGRKYCCFVASLRLAWATQQDHIPQRGAQDIGVIVQLVDCLPSMHGALGSSSTLHKSYSSIASI